MKKALLALAVAGAAVSAQADVSVSGHVNYSAGDLEDFTGNQGFDVRQNGASGSRFRIVASKEANGITYGTRQELGLTTGGTGALNTRVSQFTIGGDFGQVSLGQGWESGDDAAEQDFSGTYLLTGSGKGAFGFDSATSITIVDGGRDNRLRYDSPKLGGVVKIVADYDTTDNVGLAVFAGGSNWKAAIFTEQKGDTGTGIGATDDNTDEVGGSIAFKAGPITAAFQFGDRDGQGATNEREATNMILGYRQGKISVAIDRATFETTTVAGVKVLDHETTGLSFVYRPTGGVELYSGFRSADANDSTSTVFGQGGDGTAFIVGGRVKF